MEIDDMWSDDEDTENIRNMGRQTDPFTCGTPELHERIVGIAEEIEYYMKSGVFNTRPLPIVVLLRWHEAFIRQQQRIAALEKALVDANQWVRGSEGVSLDYYSQDYGDKDSVAVLNEVIARKENGTPKTPGTPD